MSGFRPLKLQVIIQHFQQHPTNTNQSTLSYQVQPITLCYQVQFTLSYRAKRKSLDIAKASISPQLHCFVKATHVVEA